ncbi:site-specific recombinase XerD [Polynucleobacter sphagniphilus]|jgi:site-specific recombinase XerD|uniref:hypothetical protein n=1 Tax=Polynucleobacter TaxID=44013 RepID=UPI002476F7B2|nr:MULTISPECIES: hypothetical protein [Polynucleobacter]MDH6242273.1 site-specific recombinase XerD [Polynucleobacter sphagniphilus]MEA9566911.1 hypothetical protein [Polynucleobacter sp. AP-Nickl1-40-C4]MEA9569018.1 hypothetical protein [Polynucleobacter sp. AP-Nickl1-40-C4]
MNHKNNPMIELSRAETQQLKELWARIRNRVQEQRDNFVWVRLCAHQARLSRKQLWMVVSTLANLLEDQPIPLFVYGYLDQQQWDAGLEKTINPKNTV